MTHRFLAPFLAAVLAITSLTATPARAADQEDIARLLAGLAAVAIIGQAIRNEQEKDKKKKKARKSTSRRSYDSDGRYYDDRRYDRPRDRKLLPPRCLRSFDTRNGTRHGFGPRCLNRHYDYAHRLPDFCLTRIRVEDGSRRIYSARCLRNEGYRLERG